VGGIISSIFGGDKPDNSAQMAQMEADNRAQREKMDAWQKKLDDDERKRQEAISASARARRGGGARALLASQRLTPEAGLPGQDSTQTTLGPKA
jgi:hypothetical protein